MSRTPMPKKLHASEPPSLGDLVSWLERAKLAQELVVGTGPFDPQCSFFLKKRKAYDTVTTLLVALEAAKRDFEEPAR